MRSVATYSLTRGEASSIDVIAEFNQCRELVDEWIGRKGAADHATGQCAIVLADGRQADLGRYEMDVESGRLSSLTLNEPSGAGRFETYLAVAHNADELVFFCELRTGTNEVTLASRPFAARCPTVVRSILNSAPWLSGKSLVVTEYSTLAGRPAGRQLLNAIWDSERTLPVVVISEHDQFPLHPDLARNLAYDLVGMATIVEIDAEASWLLTEIKGREWSCYAGAIRVYWPFERGNESPFSHQLWTQSKLLSGSVDTVQAADRIRAQIRRMIFSRSAFRGEPNLIARIRAEYRAAQVQRATEATEFEELARAYEEDVAKLNRRADEQAEEILRLQIENDDLKAQVTQLNQAMAWVPSQGDDIQPDTTTPPDTVTAAVQQAREVCGSLIFGRDVDDGVSGLASEAGPPDKILDYLMKLDALAKRLPEGPLGATIHQWLRERNVTMSGESETTLGSDAKMAKRTWDDGSGNRRRFTDHLKPNDSTAPDRCVRIYHDYSVEAKKIIVAWVGRHPDNS